ncbi:MAG: RNA methyltransferase, partial [Roseibium sp.]
MTIAELGHRGVGIAHSEGGQVYVPGALPGEEVTADVSNGRAANVTYIKTSPDRIEPICKHYESCGGCSMQHLAEESYLDWKRGLVVKALADRGIEAEVSPVVPSNPGSRRRAVL